MLPELPVKNQRNRHYEYQRRKFKLLEWSKYRYTIIKDIFDFIICSDHYKLYLNGLQIFFDYYSLTHILTRHYGHTMKTYHTDKSHFTEDVHHEHIHLELEKIFKKIDASLIYNNQPIKEVNIRLNRTLYKIYIDEETNGGIKFLRLNTFFPIENSKMIKKLNEKFEEVKIDESLAVFIMKSSS